MIRRTAWRKLSCDIYNKHERLISLALSNRGCGKGRLWNITAFNYLTAMLDGDTTVPKLCIYIQSLYSPQFRCCCPRSHPGIPILLRHRLLFDPFLICKYCALNDGLVVMSHDLRRLGHRLHPPD